LDTARSAAEQTAAGVSGARAQIALARSAIRAIETELEHTEIRAPVDGIVLSRSVEPGQVVAATFQPPTLFVIAEDLSRMQVVLLVDEADVGRVEAGQPARFTVDAFPGRSFEARVESVRNAPRTVQGVVSYEAVLSVDNEERLLRPGMTATAEIVTEEVRDALMVPSAALRFVPPGRDAQRSGSTLWRLSGGEPVATTVETGASDGERTVVLGDEISAGDVVVVDVEEPG
ncbi:MAG: efflux RND transporter periplasmic adaptor subunit, partial [Myxococcota bacterium]|nr:efflux RND transporter periplasmic adaptor subunit [Myxococcota bacterium]